MQENQEAINPKKWNNAAYEIKREKAYHFILPAQDITNFHPISTDRNNGDMRKKEESHTGSNKKLKKKKNRKKVKRKQISEIKLKISNKN